MPLGFNGFAQEVESAAALSIGRNGFIQPVESSAAGGLITGSGAANQIAYFTGAQVIAGDADLTWNPTTNEMTLTGTTATLTTERATPAAVWNYTNHLIRARGEESTGGGTIIACQHARADASTQCEFTGYRSRGTLAAPGALLSGDQMVRYAGVGYDGTAFGGSATIDFVTIENWAVGAHGTKISFRTTAIGSAVDAEVAYFKSGQFAMEQSGAFFSLGLGAATVGTIRIPNNSVLYGRNQANNGNVAMLYVDTADRVRLSDGSATIYADGSVNVVGQVLGKDGLASSPTYSWSTSGYEDDGFFHAAVPSIVHLALNGVAKCTWITADKMDLASDMALAWHSGVNTDSGSADLYLNRVSAGIGKVTNGANPCEWRVHGNATKYLSLSHNATDAIVDTESTTGGVKICAAATQKLGLWGTTPVVQPTSIADLAAFTGGVVGFLDAAERDGIRTKLNDILARLRLPGFIAT